MTVRGILRSRRTWDVAVLGTWVAVTIFAAYHHEPFRDEAEKWVNARDAESVADFFRFLVWHRSPMLWYLLLLPFAKLGAPLWTANVVNWLVSLGAVLILWFRAPLPRPVKLLFLFSYFMLYDVPVIARNYSLMTLLGFAAMALYPSRREHPYRFVLVLLAMMNTNYVAMVSAAMLGAIFVVESLQRRAPWRQTAWVALWLTLGVVAFFAQVFNSGAPGYHEVQQFAQSVPNFLYQLKETFSWVSGWHVLLALALWAAFAVSLLGRPDALLLAAASILPPAYVIWKHHLSRQYFTCILVGTLMAAWLAELEGWDVWRSPALRAAAGHLARLRTLTVWLLAVPFAISVYFGVTEVRKEHRMLFSDGAAAAAFIRSNRLDTLEIAVSPDWIGTTLLPYLEGKRVFYTGTRRWGTKIKADQAHFDAEFTPYRERMRRALIAMGSDPRFLFVSRLPVPAGPRCRLVYASDASRVIWDETYYVYDCTTSG